MKKIYFGKNNIDERIDLDLEEEAIRMIGLLGATGSGKTIFHNNLYRELSRLYTSDEIGLIFCDMTCVDFPYWKSEYVMHYVEPPLKAIELMETIPNSVKIRNKKYVFLHIEECDMVSIDRERVENALSNILSKTSNVFIIYSTSRTDPEYLVDWLKRFINLAVVFGVATPEFSRFFLGNESAARFIMPGQRILSFNNKQIECQPFSDTEIQELEEFEM